MSDNHLSFDELSELDEGLLPPERTSALRAHLHGCDECQAGAKAIATTRSMLADLPAVTMPDDVRARIDAALAAEAPQVASDITPPAADPVDSGHSGDVIPNVVALPRQRMPRPTAAASAAAAAIVLAVGAIVVAHFHHKGTTDSTLPTGGESAAVAGGKNPLNLDLNNSDFVKRATDAHYDAANIPTLTPGLLGSVRAPAVPAPSTETFATGGSGSSSGSGSTSSGSGGAATGGSGSGVSHAASSSGSGKATRPSGLSAQTNKTTAGAVTSTSSDNPAAIPRALLPLYHSAKKLNTCASGLAGSPDATPAVVDFGRWTAQDGTTTPALIFVFKTNTLDVYDVFVAKATCAADPGDSILNYQSVTVP